MVPLVVASVTDTAAETAIADKSEDVGYVLDLTVKESVTRTTETMVGEVTNTTVKNLPETVKPIAVTIDLPAEIQGMARYTVLRYHDGAVQTLTTSPNGAGEYIEMITTKIADSEGVEKDVVTALTIYAKYFSTYAVTGSETVLSTAAAKYSSTLADCENGEATLSATRSELNKVVTVTATPDEGYEVADVVVTHASGKEVAVTKQANGTYTYKQPGASVTVTVTFTSTDKEWYTDALAWAKENEIVTEAFVQDDICTRGDAVTFIWKAMGSPNATIENPFIDMTEADAYYEAALWAYEMGITTGTEQGDTFSGAWECTRSQIVTLLWRNAGMTEAEIENIFTDVTEGAWDYEAIQWAVEKAITEGTGNDMFSGLWDCTQMEIVTFLFRQVSK